ncbi:hypothetical protein EDB81DRAFT_832718 [Dactylonectria macrodidyma]|uniref:Rhodopsin domain-containing protein n=1 Tax=Dactylonectria macrodidyma TaxID=307937 RepID=A0A9P9I6U5_9HYPO|nr:hypothetical protein EDB81DRAFT_832718 [Dactylonectria macrodidyma]
MASDDAGPRLVAAVWILAVLSAIFLALRLYCKLAKRRPLWCDDYVLLISWLCLLVSVAVVTYLVRLGFGKHVQDVPPNNLWQHSLVFSINRIFAVLAVSLSKTSFALTLLRIAGRWMKLFILATITVMNILFVAYILLHWLQCTPAEKLWHPEIPGTCLPNHTLLIYTMTVAALSGVMDCILALLPWKIVWWEAQINVKEKAGVALAMSMGIFAGATAFVKTAMLMTRASTDFSYNGARLLIWGSAEIAVTIIAASIPILRVLVSDIHSSANKFSSQNSKRTTTNRTKTKTVIRCQRPDDGSERSIVAATLQGIVAISEIEVESQRAGNDADSIGYEMESF